MKVSVHVFISALFKPHPIVGTTYSSLHLFLPCDAATTSPTFLHELNCATLHKTAHPQRFFSMWHLSVLRLPTNPTDLLLANSAPQAKQEPLLTSLPATLKTLFTRFSDGLNVGVHLSVVS